MLGITGKFGAIGTGAGKVSTKAQDKAMEAAGDLRNAIKKHADATDKVTEAASKEIATKRALNSAVAKQMDELDISDAKAAKEAAKKPALDIKR